MPFNPPPHTVYQWQNAPATGTALDKAHLEAAETDLLALINQVATLLGLGPTAIKTGAYTAVASDLVPCDTTTTGFPVTLPTAPADQSRVGIKLVAGSNALTVACPPGATFNIIGGPTTLTLSAIGTTYLLQYNSANNIYYVTSFYLPFGIANGAAQLDSSAHLASAQIPTSIIQMDSGIAPQVDHTTALTAGRKLVYSTSGKLQGDLGSITLYPSNDATGTTDDNNFQNAVAALPNGGTIYLVGNSNIPFYTKAGWAPPAQTTSGGSGGGPICIQGVSIPIIKPVGNAITALSYHRTSNYGTNTQVPLLPGYIRDLEIDGASATGASIGLSAGDGMGHHISNIHVSNFTGSGAKGVKFTNTNLGGNHFYCEKSRFEVFVTNCTDCVFITAGSGSSSWEYCTFDISLIATRNQRGVVIDNAAISGSHLSIMGNMDHTDGTTNPVATSGVNNGLNIGMLVLLNGAKLWRLPLLTAKTEGQGNNTGPLPWTIWSDNSGFIQQCDGQITTGMNGIKMQGAEFSFNGLIGHGDYTGTLSDIYPSTALPASNVAWINNGPDALVTLDGGTLAGTTGTSIQINGTSTQLTATQYGGFASFVVPASCSFLVKYSSAPTFTVIPLRVSQE